METVTYILFSSVFQVICSTLITLAIFYIFKPNRSITTAAEIGFSLMSTSVVLHFIKSLEIIKDKLNDGHFSNDWLIGLIITWGLILVFMFFLMLFSDRHYDEFKLLKIKPIKGGSFCLLLEFAWILYLDNL